MTLGRIHGVSTPLREPLHGPVTDERQAVAVVVAGEVEGRQGRDDGPRATHVVRYVASQILANDTYSTINANIGNHAQRSSAVLSLSTTALAMHRRYAIREFDDN